MLNSDPFIHPLKKLNSSNLKSTHPHLTANHITIIKVMSCFIVCKLSAVKQKTIIRKLNVGGKNTSRVNKTNLLASELSNWAKRTAVTDSLLSPDFPD